MQIRGKEIRSKFGQEKKKKRTERREKVIKPKCGEKTEEKARKERRKRRSADLAKRVCARNLLERAGRFDY